MGSKAQIHENIDFGTKEIKRKICLNEEVVMQLEAKYMYVCVCVCVNTHLTRSKLWWIKDSSQVKGSKNQNKCQPES